MSKTKIKLQNIGKRTIIIGDVEFNPGQLRKFEENDAERLLSLYPDEVQDIEKASAAFDGDDDEDGDEEKGWMDHTKKEIVAFLEAAEIEHDPKAAKAVLAELADKAEADDEDGDETPTE